MSSTQPQFASEKPDGHEARYRSSLWLMLTGSLLMFLVDLENMWTKNLIAFHHLEATSLSKSALAHLRYYPALFGDLAATAALVMQAVACWRIVGFGCRPMVAGQRKFIYGLRTTAAALVLWSIFGWIVLLAAAWKLPFSLNMWRMLPDMVVAAMFVMLLRTYLFMGWLWIKNRLVIRRWPGGLVVSSVIIHTLAVFCAGPALLVFALEPMNHTFSLGSGLAQWLFEFSIQTSNGASMLATLSTIVVVLSLLFTTNSAAIPLDRS